MSGTPTLPTGDQLRAIARSAQTSASDPASANELVLAGWRAALASGATQPSDCALCNGRGFYGSPGIRCELCDGTGKDILRFAALATPPTVEPLTAPSDAQINRENEAWSRGYTAGYNNAVAALAATAAPTESEPTDYCQRKDIEINACEWPDCGRDVCRHRSKP